MLVFLLDFPFKLGLERLYDIMDVNDFRNMTISVLCVSAIKHGFTLSKA